MARPIIRKIRKLQEQESLEPMMAWGLRMCLALLIPLVTGLLTGHAHEGEWLALTAESLCWVELKGSIGQRTRVVLGGIFICLLFTLLGLLTAGSLLLSVAAMLVVAFISGLFKNLGDRGSGLAICVYVTFILNSFIPVKDADGLQMRMLLTLAGGVWYFLLAMAFSVNLRHTEPYRRSVGLIWQSISELIDTLSKGWDGRQTRSSLNAIYQKETAVRKALDTSIEFHSALAHQVSQEDARNYNLAMIRKSTALIATHIVTVGELLESVNLRGLNPEIRNLVYGMYRTLGQASRRLSTYMVSLLPEENLLLSNRLSRIAEMVEILDSRLEQWPADSEQRRKLARANAMIGRTVKQMDGIMQRLEQNISEKRVYRSYSLLKTIYVLRPAYFIESLGLLFSRRSENFRYAIRVALAAGIAMLFAKILHGSHTYWIPFTVILISQPYIGATLKRATDRVIGTVAGGIAGGLLLLIPDSFWLKVLALGLASFYMVYYIRRNYAIAAFFITISLVMLIDVESGADFHLVLIRALNTAVGAAIAILASFMLLPVWDRKKLPEHLEAAFRTNMQYLKYTLESQETLTWTRIKRTAEQANSTAFESLQRYMDEPDVRHKSFIQPFQLLNYNVRITRALNQIHLERDNSRKEGQKLSAAETNALLGKIAGLSNKIRAAYGLLPQEPLLPATELRTGEAEFLQNLITELEGLNQALEKATPAAQPTA